MTRKKTIALAIFGGLGSALLFLLAAFSVVPRLIDLRSLHEQIVTQMSQRLQGEVQLQTLHLAVWPFPHAVLDRVSVSIPGLVDGSFESVSAYPKPWALLRGHLQVGRLRLKAPNLRVLRSPWAAAEDVSPDTGTPTTIVRRVVATLAAAASAAAGQAPGLILVVDRGTVSLSTERGDLFDFTDIEARVALSPDRLTVALTCRSNLWQRMALSAAFAPTASTGSGRIDLIGVRPQLISTALNVNAGLRLADSEMNLTVRFAADRPAQLRADIDGSVRTLTLRRGAERVVVRGPHLRAALRVDEQVVTVAVHELVLTQPRLQLSGHLSLDQTAPHVSLQIEANDVDVPSVRNGALLLAGEATAPRKIFEILRGGTAQQLTFQAEGNSLADLVQGETMVIRGRVVNGRVYVPRLGLDFHNVSGTAAVANNLLVGSQLTARLRSSQTRDGTLRVGLTGGTPELFVETNVHADAADVSELLKHLATTETVARELSRLTDVQGTVSGKLILSGSTQDVQVSADVSQLYVAARLPGMPFPLRVEGGRVFSDAGEITTSDLNVSLGASTLSQFSMRLRRGDAPLSLEVGSGQSRLVLDEIYPALAASAWWHDVPWAPTTVKGTVFLDALQLRGPAATPSAWQFELSGAAQNLDIESAALRERIAVRYPLSLASVRLARDASTITCSGNVAAPDGLTASVDLAWNADGWNIRHLHLRDAQSDASLALLLKRSLIDLTFDGRLSQATLDALVDRHPLGGALQGNFRAHIFPDEPARSRVEGRLEATHVFVPGDGIPHLTIENVSLDARDGMLFIDAALDAEAAHGLHLQGNVSRSSNGLLTDLDLSAGDVDWNSVEPFLRAADGTGTLAAPQCNLPVQGALRIAAASFTYQGFTWRPVRGTVTFTAAGPTVTVTEANLCGMPMPGTIAVTRQGLTLAFKPTAERQQLAEALTCLRNAEGLATGQYALAGNITAHGQPGDIGTSMRGHVQLDATGGRIYRMAVLAKTLSVLNVATGSLGNIPDLTTDGLPYDRLTAKVDIRGETLSLREAVMDGPTVKMVGEGSIDLAHGTMELTLLVAPFKSVDSVVSRIPVMSGVLGGSLVSVPIKITGAVTDPEVIPLAPSVVGSRLIAIMNRALKLPARVIPFFPGGEKEK